MEAPLLLTLLLVTSATAQYGDFFYDWFSTNHDMEWLGVYRRDRIGDDVDGYHTDFIRDPRRGGRPEPYYPSTDAYRVRLVDGRNSREGNVEVFVFDPYNYLRDWRSVCDIGWTQAHAAAVCRQLGFSGPATATRSGRFGFRSTGFGTILRNCDVGSDGSRLRRCFHQGASYTMECGSRNIAGVICGPDRTTPFNGTMEVRLEGGRRLRGPVQVRYGARGWGPVCGDGFDLKDAAVVCRQLKLGGPVRSYLSGRDAGGAFILGEVECTGRETTMAQCRSRRSGTVRCPGGRFSGAAVECSAPPGTSNTTGARLPDLVVNATVLAESVHIESLTMGALECAMDENCLAKSAYDIRRREPRTFRTRLRRLFRFTNQVQNIGQADYRPSIPPGQWKWHTCHSHYHSEESFSEYDLTDKRTGKNATGHKASFCLEDSECFRGGNRTRYQCQIGTDRRRYPQGISAGCADIYGSYLDCQWIDITDVASGSYTLSVRINADRLVSEASFDNNQVTCDVELNVAAENATVTNCRVVPL